MKSCNDLEFLSIYWQEAKRIGSKIKNELPKGSLEYSDTLEQVNPKSTVKMFLVPFSSLGNSWSVQDILNKSGGTSKSLEALADKINYMILKNRANDVKIMVEKICTGRIKSLSKVKPKRVTKEQIERSNIFHNDYLGKGHFRWNHQAYTLSQEELSRVAEYFELTPNIRQKIESSYQVQKQNDKKL